jgi:hypothetical protein
MALKSKKQSLQLKDIKTDIQNPIINILLKCLKNTPHLLQLTHLKNRNLSNTIHPLQHPVSLPARNR